MTDARYEYLANRALDSELTELEASELAQALAEDAARQNDFVQLLSFWETWSQNAAPERSADAFVAAWKTRQSAEIDSGEFAAAIESRLSNQPPARFSETTATFAPLLAWLRRPARLACTAVVAVAIAFGLWIATSQTASARVTITGEAVCPACVLHESHQHSAAVRLRIGDKVLVYYLDRSPELDQQQGTFCSGPNPINVAGTVRKTNGHLQLKAEQVEFPLKKTPEGSRILFPL
ncbi:MAG: hypothetical protein QM715_00460 [Nibricoccus sp.]